MSAGRFLGKAVGAVALAATLVTAGAAVHIWRVARTDDRRPSDAIVVLGASQFDGRPSSILEARLRHALELYTEGVAPTVITVGGNQPGDRFTEGGTGARWMIDHGVPEGDVIAVEEGDDTLNSIRAVVGVFIDQGWHTAVIVTDPWHAMRSLRMAHDEGIDAVSSPTRSGPAVLTREGELRYVARETAAYLFYRAFHSGSDFFGPSAI